METTVDHLLKWRFLVIISGATDRRELSSREISGHDVSKSPSSQIAGFRRDTSADKLAGDDSKVNVSLLPIACEDESYAVGSARGDR